MSSINPNCYPEDLTGTSVANRVVNETVTTRTNVIRIFTPQNAPYFRKSMEIVDIDTGLTLTAAQWKPYYLVAAATSLTAPGDDVYAVVAITDQGVSNNLKITYQTVGGDFVAGFDNIVSMIKPLIADDRPVTWPNVLNRETGFNPNQHLHAITQARGFEYLAVFIETLKQAILLGDLQEKDAVLAYIDAAINSSNAVVEATLAETSTFAQHISDTNNPHNLNPTQLDLGLVQNYATATLSQAYAGTRNDLYVTADQVKKVVADTVNQGMDAHVANTSNPHGLTPAQLNLGLVQNYAVAVLSDLITPVQAQPKYVTNVVLGSYMTQFFTTQQNNIAQALTGVQTQIGAVALQATQAKATADDAQTMATTAITKSTQAATLGASALTQANANKLELASSNNSVQTLMNTYVAAATAAARAEGYDAGYAAGKLV